MGDPATMTAEAAAAAAAAAAAGGGGGAAALTPELMMLLAQGGTAASGAAGAGAAASPMATSLLGAGAATPSFTGLAEGAAVPGLGVFGAVPEAAPLSLGAPPAIGSSLMGNIGAGLGKWANAAGTAGTIGNLFGEKQQTNNVSAPRGGGGGSPSRMSTALAQRTAPIPFGSGARLTPEQIAMLLRQRRGF